jgi:NADH:ubiquinone oxidoreductase subunit F (NADH-binding)
MTRYNVILVQLTSLIQELTELKKPVADNTRVWCTPCTILGNECVDHMLGKRLRKIKNMKRNTKTLRNKTSRFNGTLPTIK